MKLNKLGKSPAFFITDVRKLIDKDLIKKITKYSKKNNCDSRICLHEKPFKGSQYMVICKIKRERETSFKHNKKKFFLIISGKIEITYLKTKIILSNKKNLCFLLDKNIVSKTKSLTNSSVYLELMTNN